MDDGTLRLRRALRLPYNIAEINSPVAVGYYLQTGANPGWLAYANPLFWTLYLHTVATVISVGGFVAASLTSLEKDVEGVGVGLLFGFGFLLVQLVFGPLYWYSLSLYSPLFFDAVNITLGPLFGVKLVVVVVLPLLGYRAYKVTKAGVIRPRPSGSLLSPCCSAKFLMMGDGTSI